MITLGKSSSMSTIFLILFLLVVLTEAQSRNYHRVPLNLGGIGPESIAFDCDGNGPYTGVSDGRILRWQGPQGGWTEFAVTSPYRARRCDGLNGSPLERYCGRPLGLKFDRSTCELYIADSSLGLMKVGRNGGVATSLATGANGVPFQFLNALDIDSESRVVYFTDTSSRYRRWDYMEAMTRMDNTGRLLRYDIKTGAVTVLLNGLYFANGVALSRNKDFVLVAETTRYQVRRLWLTGTRAGTSDIFARLSGRPDNINRNSEGDFWVAQNPSKPVKLGQLGEVKESLSEAAIVDASDVVEFGNRIWVGSVVQNYHLYITRT